VKPDPGRGFRGSKEADMRVRLLYQPGCNAMQLTLETLEKVLREEGFPGAVECVPVSDAKTAAREGHHGSVTVQVDGEDLEPAARKAATGLG
jgi:hypothetical protein